MNTPSTSPIVTIAASRAVRSRRPSNCARKASRPATAWIACNVSHVCPTGVDIRGGANLGCIQCGLCIDACDAIMTKLGRATGLIAYDTDLNIKQRIEGKKAFYKLVRMRTVLYAAIIAVVGGIMIYTLATRDSEGISIIHDRNPMYRAAVGRRAAQRLHDPHRQQAAQVPRLHCQCGWLAVDAGGFCRACRRAPTDVS